MTKVLFLCSSPTPYKNPLFERIASQPGIDLFLCFCVWKSETRPWNLGELKGVRYEVLKGWHLPTGKGNYLRINWPIISRLQKEEPDVVVIAGYHHPTMLLVLFYCLLTRTPFVMQGETWKRNESLKARLKRWLLHPFLFKARGFLVTGKLAREYWRREGYPMERTRVFANTPDIEYFERERAKVGAEEVNNLRARWGCGERRVGIFVGRLIKVKGVELILEGLRALDGDQRPFIVIVGDGTERESLERQAEGLPVHFAGFLQMEELPAVYAAAEFFVLPSRREPWGVVVNEAMACGLPVMLSDQVGACGDLLDSSEKGNGVLCAGPSSNAVAEGLRVMAAKSQAELLRMGRRSCEIVQGWKYEQSVQGFVEICELATKGQVRAERK